MTSFSTLHSKIDALGRLIAKDSISPTYLASLLDEMVGLMESIDMTDMRDDIGNAIKNAKKALQDARDSLTVANTAGSIANSAVQSARSAIETANNAVSKADEANSLAADAQGKAQMAVDIGEKNSAIMQGLTKRLDRAEPKVIGVAKLNANAMMHTESPITFVDFTNWLDDNVPNISSVVPYGTVVTYLTADGWRAKRFVGADSSEDFQNVKAWDDVPSEDELAETKADREELSNVLAADPLAQWEAPEMPAYCRLFIDMWNKECAFAGRADRFGKYNAETGFFELNEITDITYDEALRIWARSRHATIEHRTGSLPLRGLYSADGWGETTNYGTCRTYFPPILSGGYSAGYLTDAFRANQKIETITFIGGYGEGLSNFAVIKGMFCDCVRLRKILCHIGYPYVDSLSFRNCRSLEYLNITMYVNSAIFGNLDLRWSPKLSDESISRIINQAVLQKESYSMEIILHPEAYERVTDELFEAAAAKNITIATT